jgi:CheY-like chemotaxis protein
MQVAEFERKSPQHRILAAEDQRVNRRLMEFIFADLGCELKLVSDGKKAIEALRECRSSSFFSISKCPNWMAF